MSSSGFVFKIILHNIIRNSQSKEGNYFDSKKSNVEAQNEN